MKMKTKMMMIVLALISGYPAARADVGGGSSLETVAAEYRKAIQALDPSGWANLFSLEGQFQDYALMPAAVTGQAQLAGFFHSLSDMLESIPVLKSSGEKTYGNMVKFDWSYIVKAKNGRKAAWTGTTVLIVDSNSKISQALVFWDAKKGLSDLGVPAQQ